jgi:hypothetical protein
MPFIRPMAVTLVVLSVLCALASAVLAQSP